MIHLSFSFADKSYFYKYYSVVPLKLAFFALFLVFKPLSRGWEIHSMLD